MDAGCGEGGIISEFKDQARIIGIDIDDDALSRNKDIHTRIVGDLESIPLGNCSIDVVVSEFVLEHVGNPLTVFKEISRVLKHNGVFIFLTPNVMNPIMAMSKLLPYRLHKQLRESLLKKQEKPYPTCYRANTYNKLMRFAGASGFSMGDVSRAGNPEYLGFCKALVPLAISFEKALDIRVINIFKMYLIGCFIK